jgi:hypothetical protein
VSARTIAPRTDFIEACSFPGGHGAAAPAKLRIAESPARMSGAMFDAWRPPPPSPGRAVQITMHTRWRRPRVAVAPKENLRGGGGGRQRVGPPRKTLEAISQASPRPGPRRGGGAAAARHRRRSHFDFHFLSLGFSCFCGVGLAHTGFFSFPFRLPFPCLLCSFGCLPQVALGFRPRLPRGSLVRCFSLFTRGGGSPPPRVWT